LFRPAALFCTLLLLTAVGCARSPIEQAMAGKFDHERNNKIITAYCTSCHSHKDFQAPPHQETVSTLYEEKPYQGATECRICHQASLKGWAIPWVKRHTYRPHGSLIPLAKRAKPAAPSALQ
jgi:cytochrome c5